MSIDKQSLLVPADLDGKNLLTERFNIVPLIQHSLQNMVSTDMFRIYFWEDMENI